MWNLSRALMTAKETIYIYIHDWMLSPGVVGHSEDRFLQLGYRRGTATGKDKYRPYKVLERKPKQDVKIYVVLF